MRQSARPARWGITLLLALLLCGVLTLVHRQSVRVRGSDPLTGGVRDVALVPAQTWSTHVGRWWHDTITACFAGPLLARKNRSLAAQVHTLMTQNKDLQEAQTENSRFRALLGFQQKSPLPLLAAEVVAIDPNAQINTLILARGQSDGIRPRTVVLAPNGALVGQVLDVASHSCSVLLLTDTGSSVGGQVVRRFIAFPRGSALSAKQNSLDGTAQKKQPLFHPLKNGPIGICQGDRAGGILLTDLPAEADVRVGDQVVSSGLGGVFPKGVAIGTVTLVSVDKTRAVKTTLLRPAADLDHLEEVFLRLKPALPDLGSLPTVPQAAP